MELDLMKAIAVDLLGDESFVPHVYLDSRGFQTIGIGRLVDQRAGGGITREEADMLLANDMTRTIHELDFAIPWWRGLSGNRQRALVNMAFNMGTPRLLGFRRMVIALQGGQWDTAANEALASRWAGQVGDRAQRIAALLRRG